MNEQLRAGGKAEAPDYDTLLANRFLKVYDLKNAPGGHYFEASRREGDRITAFMEDSSFKKLLPDAVTVAVILEDLKGPETDKNVSRDAAGGGAYADLPSEPLLLLNYEFRYPVGRELLSPPAGLIDPGDAEPPHGGADDDISYPDPVLRAAAREISEETGLRVLKGDRLFKVTQAAFSSPGMTDESNALACAVLKGHSVSELTHCGAEGTESFGEFELLTRAGAKAILKAGTDARGNWFSAYTWIVLLYFVSGLWQE